jgi:SAM-dependent methyltransferase
MTQSYTQSPDGIYRRNTPVQHRDEEYDELGFEILFNMQERHFWYLGRHRFLLATVDRFMGGKFGSFSAVDLGGGVGGWLRYLFDHRKEKFQTTALADSSEIALKLAKNVLPSNTKSYQIDLMNLGWEGEWDCAFMLDVIEHIPDDLRAVQQAANALKPGGYLFITAPALMKFWSYNDELGQHLRRYDRRDFKKLAMQTGLELCDVRYFMFFLSPLYWFSRKAISMTGMSDEQKKKLVANAHRIPMAPINKLLTAIFCLETPVGHWVPFPWGTSVIGVFRKNL